MMLKSYAITTYPKPRLYKTLTSSIRVVPPSYMGRPFCNISINGVKLPSGFMSCPHGLTKSLACACMHPKKPCSKIQSCSSSQLASCFEKSSTEFPSRLICNLRHDHGDLWPLVLHVLEEFLRGIAVGAIVMEAKVIRRSILDAVHEVFDPGLSRIVVRAAWTDELLSFVVS